MTSQRVISKSLITYDDIEHGEGTVQQSRHGGNYTLNQFRALYPVNTEEELTALDKSKHPKVTKFLNGLVYFYRHNGTEHQHTPLARVVNEETTAYVTFPVEGKDVIVITSATAHTITSFVNGVKGQQITLIATNGNTTVEHNANTILQGAVNKTLSANESITLVHTGSIWVQI